MTLIDPAVDLILIRATAHSRRVSAHVCVCVCLCAGVAWFPFQKLGLGKLLTFRIPCNETIVRISEGDVEMIGLH